MDGSFQRASYQYPTLRLRNGARLTGALIGVLAGALLGTLTGAVRPLPYEDLWIATICICHLHYAYAGLIPGPLFGVSKLSGVGTHTTNNTLSPATPYTSTFLPQTTKQHNNSTRLHTTPHNQPTNQPPTTNQPTNTPPPHPTPRAKILEHRTQTNDPNIGFEHRTRTKVPAWSCVSLMQVLTVSKHSCSF